MPRLVIAVLVVLAAAGAAAQDAPIKSMGQPWRLKPYLGGSYTWDREGEHGHGGIGVLGVYKDRGFPMTAALGVSLEGYLGGTSGNWDGGGRLLATSRLFFLGLGVDYNARTEKADFILSFNPYFRRGGLFRTGGNFRIDWVPGRGNSWNFGFQIPLEPHMGKTRPVTIGARLPKPPRRPPPAPLPKEAEAALSDLRHAASWLIAYTHAFDDDSDKDFASTIDGFRRRLAKMKADMEATDERHPQGHTYEVEKAHYDEALDRALASAAGLPDGRALGDLAREVFLEEVLFPYDRLIGQYDLPNTLLGLAARGRLRLATALAAQGLTAREDAILAVYDGWAALVEEGRTHIEAHWEGDERKAWLPLELGLRPEQIDSQADLDAVIGRALGRGFERGNAIFPTNASRFELELLRSLQAAREYHVLWIHDYAGITDGEPDPIAHRATIEGYLKAMTERVREYDRTGVFPAYMIMHTQWFYESNRSRLFLSLLEDPLGAELKLGAGHAPMEAALRAAQDELRQAVACSERLTAFRREQGEKRLRQLIKVHVNVTFPADLSFRSARLVPFLKFTPDTVMLDHRKLLFYDVSEEDPRRGAAAFTGTGVGLVYAAPTWEDRGLLVTGPALLELKAAARRLLAANGLQEDEIPMPLRPREKPANYDALVAELEARGHRAHGLNVHNEVGFAEKQATFMQSMLYTLVPRDTLIVSPDSIWANPFWAGQLVGAALRGCHVYIIAPSLENAPAPSPLVMSRTREIFSRLLESRSALGSLMRAAGGQLRVGAYTRRAPSGDTLAKLREVQEGLKRYPFLVEEFPFPPTLLAMLEEEAAALEKRGYRAEALGQGGRTGYPKMHRKTQLLVGRSALRALAADPATVEALRDQLDAIAEVTSHPSSVLEEKDPFGGVNSILTRMREDPPTEARDALYYLTVGSKNQDPRSAFLDGETAFVVSGPSALWSYPDFMFLMAATTWVDSTEELTKLIPVTGERTRKLGRAARRIL